MSPSKNYPKRYGWWRVILSPSRHWAPAFIAPFANFLQFQQCQSFGGFQWTRQIWGFTQVWWAFMMMVVIWYHHQLSIPLNTVRKDSYLVCIESDSGLPMDAANESDFGLGFDLTLCKRSYRLQSISTVEENESVLVRIKFRRNMARYCYYIETVFVCVIFVRFLLSCWMPVYVSLFSRIVWFASLSLLTLFH